MKPRNRIDPTAAPAQRKPMAPWARRLLVSLAGAGLAALCPFIPIPVVSAVCVAVSGVVTTVHVPLAPEEPPHD